MSESEMSMNFHHIHVYCDSLNEVAHYKGLEAKFNKLQPEVVKMPNVTDGQAKFKELFSASEIPKFVSQKQDLLQQLISGLGWRIAGWHEGGGLRTALVRSSDERGVKFVLSAPLGEPASKKRKTDEEYDHFSVAHHERYCSQHAGRGGIGVLCFEVEAGGCARVEASYKAKHPKLFRASHEYKGGFKVTEVFSYYLPSGDEADMGTMLRFIERPNKKALLPGLEAQEAEWAVPSEAYFDHWVSNVVDRKGFIKTMNDTLGFTPKVDFNAGVVAAGEAIIESTVIGNQPTTGSKTAKEILVDQSQIYLPINNALSEVGHVHLYIEQLGQGIQHIASRVPDLLQFIARTNKFREATGHGFSFLNIPRSYYGRLTEADLAKLPKVDAKPVFDALIKADLMDSAGIVLIDITHEQIKEAIAGVHNGQEAAICKAVSDSRFVNLTKLLGKNFSDETYVEIVRNKILVDIQEKDVLYQIFTSCVLQNQPDDEAPFLEFIQRKCSERLGPDGKPVPIRPGCGGFGIRNFLTLFLSIEVSKAMNALKDATLAKDDKAKSLAQEQVDVLTAQLDESNPILTDISDAMTAEADALANGQTAEAKEWADKKAAAQIALQACSDKYKAMMREIRTRA